MKILNELKKKYHIEIVVVIQGLTPPKLREETAGLENSFSLWKQQSSDQKILFNEIRKRYGAQFYLQEIQNAANISNVEWLIAPYLVSS